MRVHRSFRERHCKVQVSDKKYWQVTGSRVCEPGEDCFMVDSVGKRRQFKIVSSYDEGGRGGREQKRGAGTGIGTYALDLEIEATQKRKVKKE